jgi:acyl-CoA synthetase (NDP forming)
MNPTAKKLLAGRAGALAENEVKDLLHAYGIPTTKYQVIRTEQDLKKISVRFPVALKVCSPAILHKTDVGGVKLNIQDETELHHVFREFRKKWPRENLLVDQMEKTGVEIIIGLIQDPTFGLSIMCGIGGIFTELYKDVSFRVVPIDAYDARQMIEELAGKKLLEGFRGMKASKQLVIDLVLKVSKLGEDLIDFVDQMDLNPVFVYKKRVCVVDAKFIVKEKVQRNVIA